jgi:hypothetical protein
MDGHLSMVHVKEILMLERLLHGVIDADPTAVGILVGVLALLVLVFVGLRIAQRQRRRQP